MQDIAMLYHGNNEDLHPAHRGFAESIDADIISIANTSPHSVQSFYQELSRAYSTGNYDIIVAEGSRPLYTGLVHKGIYDSDLVYLCADHRLYELWNNSIEVESAYDLFKYILGTHGKPVVRAVAQHGIDGVIAVSEFVADYLRPIFQDKVPTQIAHPYIQPGLCEQLGQVNVAFDTNVAVTIGRSTRYKGVDILVDAWPDVRKRHSDAKLHVVGKDHPTSYENITGVTVHGYVDDIVKAYSEASLYVQPSRVDPFPVTVLEALRTGLPAVVTEKTGSKSEIKKIDRKLMSSVTPEGLAQRINWFLGLPEKEKRRFSETAESIGAKFDPRTRKQRFRSEFQELITEIKG